MENINLLKSWVFLLTCLICINLSFSLKTYDLNIQEYSPEHYHKLNELIGKVIDSVQAKVYEYDQLSEFTQVSGAPFFVSAFSNKQGIHIQSRHLLGKRFKEAMIHELIHYTIKKQYPVPPWFEEGLVCLITQEFSQVTDIRPMKNVEDFDIQNAQNNWELVAYCLGCVEKVSEFLDSEPVNIAIP